MASAFLGNEHLSAAEWPLLRQPTMLAVAHAHNLSFVMPKPIPWYGLSRRCVAHARELHVSMDREIRKIETLATSAVQRAFQCDVTAAPTRDGAMQWMG
jgi:hypothetical protein